MDRRDFLGLRGRGVGGANGAASGRGVAWSRPPFAEAERDFLINCTRCDKCIAACQFGTLFRLAEGAGEAMAGTPAMDVRARGCHMCADWPCVAACAPDALKLPPSDADGALPEPEKFAAAWIDTAHCLPYRGPECGACAGSCPVTGALQWRGTRPVIDARACTGCGLCREACIMEPKAVEMALQA
jgi:ferredoxin-type protein NapG